MEIIIEMRDDAIADLLSPCCDGGEGGNRTRDRAFAEPGLTTWLPRHRLNRSSEKRTGGTKRSILPTVNALAKRKSQRIIPAATVSLVCESIRMKLPVERLR
jgi:hypothetical protein